LTATVEADITSAAEVLAGGEFDAVLHFAAKSLVGESVVHPSLYWRTNVCGTRALLDAIAENRVPGWCSPPRPRPTVSVILGHETRRRR